MSTNKIINPLESLDALHEYVHQYADREVTTACDSFYESFINWEARRSKATKDAEALGEQLVHDYILTEA